MECVDTLTAMGLHAICNDFIEETNLYHQDPYIVHKLKKSSFRPRRLIPCAVAVGGFTGKEHSTNRCVDFVGMCIFNDRANIKREKNIFTEFIVRSHNSNISC